MKYSYITLFISLLLASVGSMTTAMATEPLIGAGAHQGKCQIFVGDAVATTLGQTDASHSTHGHIQGTLELTVNTWVDGITIDTRLSTYPNPTDQFLYISRDIPGEADYTITSVSGRLAMQGHLSESLEILDLGSLAPGLYILNIYHSNTNLLTAKIIKR